MDRLLSRTALYWLAAWLIWVLLIIFLSLTPQPPQLPVPLLSWDKLQHAFAYALLMFLTGYSWNKVWPAWLRVWQWAAISSLALGCFLEVLQGMMKLGRSAELNDVFANTCGVLAAALLIRTWRLLPRKRVLNKAEEIK